MGLLIHKELAHAVRLRILARRNDSNRKRIFKLVADSSQLMSFILIPAFLTTCTDPSHSFRMTLYRLMQESWSRPPEGARGARSAAEDTRLP